MPSSRTRRPENVAGDLFVDDSCIDCDTCRWMAPATFDRAGAMSRVHSQPADDASRHEALKALVSCPTGSIRSEQRLAELPEAMAALPAALEGPVFHCGWAAEASFGAASWLVQRETGNVLVDSPRYTPQLAKRLEELGGVHTLFLTHKDDVADHARFAEHFGARRVLHAADVVPGTEDVEIMLEGEDDVALADDLLVIPTPGHTEGSLCLLVGDRFLFSGDHVYWNDDHQALRTTRAYCQFDWDVQRASVERLASHRFRWILPGHGRKVALPPADMRQALLACAEWMGGVRPR
jgi:glyoxylase-like metal-dependent hydrolase (beta-lactamase superfamily II)/ferredoxin